VVQVNVMPDDGFADLDSASESDQDKEKVVWARSGLEAEAYLRRRSIWKNVIKAVVPFCRCIQVYDMEVCGSK